MSLFSHFITDIIVVAVVLGFMIFVHELGHFIVAKRFGVRVFVFSLGFGKRIWGFTKGETDYRISVLPFGGYVKMAGEDPSEARHDDPGDFLAHPRWQRFAIAVAGPTMNILSALVILAVLYTFHYQKPAYAGQPARIGEVQPNSPAAEVGLQAGDLIVRMGNIEHPTWENVQVNVLMAPGQPIPLEVERNGNLFGVTLMPQAQGEDRVGDAGFGPCWPSVIGQVDSGLPASRAGMKPGDRVLAVDGKSVPCWQDLASLIQANGGKAVTLTVQRGQQPLQISLQPVRHRDAGQERWIIGAYLRMDVVTSLPPGRAIVSSWKDNVQSTVLTFEALKKILTRRLSARSLSGPVGIAQLSGSAYRAGLVALLSFTAFISLQLGIVNLFPIPMLDGGMILMLFIEAAIQRDLSLQFKERVVQAGIFLLLLLVVFVTYNDVIKALGHY